MERYDYEYQHGNGRVDGDVRAHSTPDLLKELFQESSVLLKEEFRLAKIEATREAKKAAKAGASMGVGGVLLHTGWLAFAGFLIAVGATFMPVWLSALIVSILLLAGGAALAMAGKKKLEKVEPDRTLSSLKEDKEWVKDTMQSIRSQRHGNA